MKPILEKEHVKISREDLIQILVDAYQGRSRKELADLIELNCEIQLNDDQLMDLWTDIYYTFEENYLCQAIEEFVDDIKSELIE